MAQIGTWVGGLFIGAGLATAGFFVSQTTLNERIGANTANVKGLSERVVPADLGIWSLSYNTTSRDYNNVAGTFKTAEANAARLNHVLTSAGFSPSEVNFTPRQKRDFTSENRDYEIIDRYYSVGGSVQISTTSPEKITPARSAVFELAKEGIDVQEGSLEYKFTKLNEIKPDMLREASENARIAANEFAQNAGVEVGGIQSASQGGFQVQPTALGAGSNSSVNKLVRVVTTITFYLEN
jgi:hypothetical protein